MAIFTTALLTYDDGVVDVSVDITRGQSGIVSVKKEDKSVLERFTGGQLIALAERAYHVYLDRSNFTY